MINVRRIERITERVINKLNINDYVVGIEFRDEPSTRYGCIEKTFGGHKVIVYTYDCTEEEIIHTIAHELRHIWQISRGYKITGKYKNLYYKTYDSNIFEIDADRFGDIVAYGKKYRKNSDGLYINTLHIAKYGIHTLIAKTVC